MGDRQLRNCFGIHPVQLRQSGTVTHSVFLTEWPSNARLGNGDRLTSGVVLYMALSHIASIRYDMPNEELKEDRLVVRIEPSLKKRLSELARADKRTLSQLVQMILKAYVVKKQKK
jgi:hypothetical protein